jgi:hypothetical protein
MSQYLVSLLAKQPESELRTMQEKVRADQAKARAEIERLQLEDELIEDALERQTRRTPPRAGRRSGGDGSTRARVLNVFRTHPDGVVAPASVIAALRASGSTVSSGAIRNMIRRLVEEQEVEKLREGAYKLASRNGVSPDADSGHSENGAGEPLSMVTQPQEDDQQ